MINNAAEYKLMKKGRDSRSKINCRFRIDWKRVLQLRICLSIHLLTINGVLKLTPVITIINLCSFYEIDLRTLKWSPEYDKQNIQRCLIESLEGKNTFKGTK